MGSLFDGLKYIDRFAPLNKKNPYRIVNGTVMDVFINPEDEDYHVNILVNEKYRDLIKVKFVLFSTLAVENNVIYFANFDRNLLSNSTYRKAKIYYCWKICLKA